MDPEAFCDLVERSAKYARSNGRRLRIFFEASGKREDRDIVAYMRELKQKGLPFDGLNVAAHRSLTADEFRKLILGEPKRRAKNAPLIQIADLYLYPMAKAGYDSSYKPYRALMMAGRLIDAVLLPEERSVFGIKYSYFDGVRRHKKT